MQSRTLITGRNFSGRSQALLKLARDPSFAPASFFVGPYAEAALSGLSSTLADEILVYRTGSETSLRQEFSTLDFISLLDRKPQTLSGGEQVLLALHCFSRSSFSAIAIDTALEQLDGANRAAALAYLDRGHDFRFNAALIDNRIDAQAAGWSCIPLKSEAS